MQAPYELLVRLAALPALHTNNGENKMLHTLARGSPLWYVAFYKCTIGLWVHELRRIINTLCDKYFNESKITGLLKSLSKSGSH